MLSALVLTAGLGTRLDPLTRLVAKAAVPVGSRTLVEHVLAWLVRQGVRDVVLNLHHHPASITAVVGDGAHLGLSVRYSWEQPLLGSAGGPRHALPLLTSDPFLIINGDTLCDVALEPMIDAHTRSGADVTMAVVPNPAPDHYNGIRLDASDAVSAFVPRGEATGTWHFVGIQVAHTRAFADLPDGVSAESVAGRYRDMITSRPGSLRAWRVTAPFLDVGTPKDYLRAAGTIASRTPGVLGHAVSASSIVWPDAVVEANVTLEESIVAGPVRIPSGFVGRQQVIVPASVSRPDDRVAIIDGLACFPLR